MRVLAFRSHIGHGTYSFGRSRKYMELSLSRHIGRDGFKPLLPFPENPGTQIGNTAKALNKTHISGLSFRIGTCLLHDPSASQLPFATQLRLCGSYVCPSPKNKDAREENKTSRSPRSRMSLRNSLPFIA